MSEVVSGSAFNIVFLYLAKSEAVIERREVRITSDLRLLDAYCGKVDGTAIDAPAKPRHERVLGIRVASYMYPAIQNC